MNLKEVYNLNILKEGTLFNDGQSIVDLGNCEDILKEAYGIDKELSLIIKKVEQKAISAERNVQYEVYHPISKIKLNLSLCDEEKVELYIPVAIDDKLLVLYEDLQNSGYDLFNIEDPFYNDLCSPYKSENGTDVLLSDRKNDYYNNNYTTCQSNCEYSSFNAEYQFLKCECKVIVDDIDINDFDKFTKKIYKNFYDILKNSNYKILKCYNLVFNPKYLKQNVGSFVVIGLFTCFLSFFGIYIIKGISPLKQEILNTMNIKFEGKKDKSLKEKKLEEKQEKQDIVNSPPKKIKSKVINIENPEPEGKDEEENEKIERKKSLKKKSKRRKSKSKKDNDIGNNMIYETNNEILDKIENDNINKKRRKSKSKITEITEKKYDDLDLVNMNYETALESDKRTFFQVYWSKLKSKHLLIFTFLSCNDHNLIYIKIARFLFLITTSMAMNVVFFFDSSMHKIYLDYGKYNFITQIPQIIYSSIVSLVIEILIGILSYTDKNIYQIRQLKDAKSESLSKIMKAIRIKLIIFFVITFLFFFFYWYLIAAFCSVYSNTQIIYLKDFITSFSLGLVYPFAIQLCFAFLRIFSLKENSKGRSLLYKIC